MDPRDETIRTVDQAITGINDKWVNYDPTDKKLWHPTEAEVTGMPSLEGSLAAFDDLAKVIDEMSGQVTSVYSGLEIQDSTMQLGAQAVQEQVAQLQAFAEEVIPAGKEALRSGAETCNTGFQYIRQANAESRQAIAESRAHSQFGPIPYGDPEMDNAKLTSKQDEVDSAVKQVEGAANTLRENLSAWEAQSSRAGYAPSTEGAENYSEGGGRQVDTDVANNPPANTANRVMPINPGGGPASNGGVDLGGGSESSGSSSDDGDQRGLEVDTPELGDGVVDPQLGDGLNADAGLDTADQPDHPGLEVDDGFGSGLGEDSGFGTDLPEYDGGSGLGVDEPEMSSPLEADTSFGDGLEAPEDIGTQTSGWSPLEDDQDDEEDLDSFFDDLDADDEGEDADEDPDGSGSGGDTSLGGDDGADLDAADPQGAGEDVEDSGVFGDNLDGDSDLPAGGASDGGTEDGEGGIEGVDAPEMGDTDALGAGTDGEGGWLTQQLTGEDGEGVTADVKGDQVEFPNQPSADLAEDLAGDGSMTLRDAAAEAGFEVPGDGQDIGTAVDPVDLQPGDVVSDSSGDYLYLGDDRAIGSDGEIKEFGEDFPTFDDAHQGFFRMDAGDAGEDMAPTAGSEASGSPEAPASGDVAGGGSDGEPTEASAQSDDEPIERREDAPVGLGGGQFTPDTDTATTAADGAADPGDGSTGDSGESSAQATGDVESPSLEAEGADDASDDSTSSDESSENSSGSDGEGISFGDPDDQSPAKGTVDADSGDSGSGDDSASVLFDSGSGESVGDADSADSGSDSDSTSGAAGTTGSSVAGGTVADTDEPLDADSISPY